MQRCWKMFVGLIALVAMLGDGRAAETYTYVSGYTACKCPIYTKRVATRTDRWGRPVYTYHRQKVKHRCRAYQPGREVRVQFGDYGVLNYYGCFRHRFHRHPKYRKPREVPKRSDN